LAKNLKLNIKNTQLAKALNLGGVKKKTPAKKDEKMPEEAPEVSKEEALEEQSQKKQVRARSRSAFAEQPVEEAPAPAPVEEKVEEVKEVVAEVAEKAPPAPPLPPAKPKEKPAPVYGKGKLPPPRQRVVIKQAAPKPAPKPPTRPAAADAGAADRKPITADRAKKTFREERTKPAPSAHPFDSRDRYGLRVGEEQRFRRRKGKKPKSIRPDQPVIRPTELTVRLPVTIKDLAAAMKLKASQLIQKLFMQGIAMTLNDLIDDETTLLLLGEEFGCTLSADTSEEERIRITDKSIKEEISEADPSALVLRGPVVAFMGHVDHGKTSLIDRIRSSNIVSGEAGAITQHIGAFQTQTEHGPITILDTPGHEAFTAMRARGADVTDVVILVVAGDEGIKAQTSEAIQHARAAGVIILVAINKCDKPGFDAENVYRQLSELELLPEKWGGQIVTVNCSAATGEGVSELLEMVALQSEVLELKADPTTRARGTVLESEMHKGLGATATILVQNGTLRSGDPVVFDDLWGRVKTMKDEFGGDLAEAGPGMPVAITGLSGIPQAGSEFIVVSNEKEAREIAETRHQTERERRLSLRKRKATEGLLLQAAEEEKKVLNLILRADVQGSLEALKTSLQKISSEKAEVNIIFEGVGAISESDVELATASNAVIIGFHTKVESHADELVRQHKVEVRTHDVIYHAVDDVTSLLTGRLDKVAEERETGAAEVRATFKSSAVGVIAGCFITDGIIQRANKVRQLRNGEVIWQGGIANIKREKEDVREIKAGFECGITLDGQRDIEVGDILQAYEVVYVKQEL
jgi:translation initiation factor IF-2